MSEQDDKKEHIETGERHFGADTISYLREAVDVSKGLAVSGRGMDAEEALSLMGGSPTVFIPTPTPSAPPTTDSSSNQQSSSETD